MMTEPRRLSPVQPEPGKPLYLVARDHLRRAIDEGVFAPGEQIPSTKELSERLAVSLVTAHRALQELVSCGVLRRAQGRGTFVHAGYALGQNTVSQCRLGIVLAGDACLSDFHHAQILEGIRQAAQTFDSDLILLRFGEDLRRQCEGLLYLSPLPSELEVIASGGTGNAPVMVLGARADARDVGWIDVDNRQAARDAVGHLTGLGHVAIAYVGRSDEAANARDRWLGFQDALAQRGLETRPQWVMKSPGWRLDERQRCELNRLLSGASRPTAVFAAGYELALDVYNAAQTLGLRIGHDLSVVAVDDSPSASFLDPPLTTIRQPLVALAQGAVTALIERIKSVSQPPSHRVLTAELVVRRSTAPPPSNGSGT